MFCWISKVIRERGRMSNWWTGLLYLKFIFSNPSNGEPYKNPERITAPIQSKRLTSIAEVLRGDAGRKSRQSGAISAAMSLIEPWFGKRVRLRAFR
jgi:hypothetical protein